MNTIINIYTDGACSGNGKAESTGSWGFCSETGGILRCLKHGEISKGTTNNREELKAVLYALKELEHTLSITDGEITANIHTDSAYVYNICTNWIYLWHNRGWTRKEGKPIENLDLIQEIYNHLTLYSNNNKNFSRLQLNFTKVKGHAGNVWNEIGDALATGNSKKIERILSQNIELITGIDINEVIK